MMIYKAAALLMFAALPTHLAIPALAQTAGADNTETSMADGIRNPNKRGPALTGGRRPLYRLRKSDVVEIQFTFSPEFDQTVTIQPDGFVALKAVDSVFAEGLTLTELHDAVVKVYQRALLDPEVSVILKDFEKPYFVAGGQSDILVNMSCALRLRLPKPWRLLAGLPRPQSIPRSCFSGG